MGGSYLAVDRQLDREFAIKLLPGWRSFKPTAVVRLLLDFIGAALCFPDA
jgi:hypothetical protein